MGKQEILKLLEEARHACDWNFRRCPGGERCFSNLNKAVRLLNGRPRWEDKRVYIGFDWSSKRRRLNTYPYAFLSAAVTWSYTNRKKLVPFEFSEATKEIFLDCGGFSFFNTYSDYPFSVVDYYNWIRAMQKTNKGKVSYVAIMDYPCEEAINRKAFSTNQERIEKTFENAQKCMNFDISPSIWVPVLQGYELDEYLYSFDLYEDHDMLTDLLAIGSMCRRTDIKEIRTILRAIRNLYDGNIHLFGLTMRALEDKAIYSMIDSCDTIGYTFGCNTLDETMEKKNALEEKIARIEKANKEQETLKSFQLPHLPQ